MSRVEITAAELLDALVDARSDRGPTGAKTLNELLATYRVGRDKMLEAVRALKAQGRLTVCYVPRESVLGVTVRVPAYVITPAKRTAKKSASRRTRAG